MNLYNISTELTARMIRLGELLQSEQTPTQAQIDEILDLKGDLRDKLVAYGYVIKNQQADIDALNNEIKRLTSTKKALENRQETLKSNMLSAMLSHDIDRIDDPIMPIRVQNSPASVRLYINVESLPHQYQKIKVDADKTALTKALKAGQNIDGVALVQGKHIRIG